jgi:hypothetical protein
MRHAFILPHAHNALDVFETSCIDIKLYYLLDISNDVRLSRSLCKTRDVIQWPTSANIWHEVKGGAGGRPTGPICSRRGVLHTQHYLGQINALLILHFVHHSIQQSKRNSYATAWPWRGTAARHISARICMRVHHTNYVVNGQQPETHASSKHAMTHMQTACSMSQPPWSAELSCA